MGESRVFLHDVLSNRKRVLDFDKMNGKKDPHSHHIIDKENSFSSQTCSENHAPIVLDDDVFKMIFFSVCDKPPQRYNDIIELKKEKIEN